jgi:hypothetical protein
MKIKFVNVRVENADHKIISNTCKEHKETISEFVRRSILKELYSLSITEEEKKLLKLGANE